MQALYYFVNEKNKQEVVLIREDFKKNGAVGSRRVRRMYEALDHSIVALKPNQTALDSDPKLYSDVLASLKGMGFTRLQNLTSKYTEGAVALSFYAGDGIVLKIIPKRMYEPKLYPLNIHPITSEIIPGDDNEYLINTYPWVPPAKVEYGMSVVESLREKINIAGLGFQRDDDHPRNISMIPDAKGTLVGIDSDMYKEIASIDSELKAKLDRAWLRYLEEIYPVYRMRFLPAQTSDTSFDRFSIHDENSRVQGFDLNLADPVIVDNKITVDNKRQDSFFNKIFRKNKKACLTNETADELHLSL